MISCVAGIDLGGLSDFIKLIKDFVLCLINGLKTLVQALVFVFQMNGSSVFWLPVTVSTVIVVSCTLVIVLRIVGR